MGMEGPVLHIAAGVASAVVFFYAKLFPNTVSLEHLPCYTLLSINIITNSGWCFAPKKSSNFQIKMSDFPQ